MICASTLSEEEVPRTIPHRGDAVHDGEGHHRRDDHADELHEAVAQRPHGGAGLRQERAESDAEDDGDEDLHVEQGEGASDHGQPVLCQQMAGMRWPDLSVTRAYARRRRENNRRSTGAPRGKIIASILPFRHGLKNIHTLVRSFRPRIAGRILCRTGRSNARARATRQNCRCRYSISGIY
jgi:hypothetical protein